MNYELAKKLKNAGFPQGKEEHCTYQACPCHSRKKCNECSNCWWIKLPTLEELIDACGERFVKLEQHEGNINNFGYLAFGKGIETPLYGKTPSEAVANLWLALQKK